MTAKENDMGDIIYLSQKRAQRMPRIGDRARNRQGVEVGIIGEGSEHWPDHFLCQGRHGFRWYEKKQDLTKMERTDATGT